MKISEIVQRIDKSESNKSYTDIYKLCEELNVDEYYLEEESHSIRSYWIGNWNCTDTTVGFRMYFMNDEPIAISSQTARKSHEVFEWLGQGVAECVQEYLISIMPPNNLHVNIVDINEDIGDNYGISFNNELTQRNKKHAMYQGESIEILERVKNKDYGIDTELKIKLLDGTIINVDINNLQFSLYVN